MQFRPPGRSLLAAVVAAAAGLACPSAQADTGALAISAVVTTNSLCRFTTGQRTLDFGSIDPSSTVPVTASVSVQFICLGNVFTGTTYSLSAGNGLYAAGAGLRRVRHATATTEFMAYTLSISPASGNLAWLAVQNVTISGSIVPVQFQNARAGAYADTVVLSLAP